MDHLENVSTDDLRTALNAVAEKTPAIRLVSVIAYKNGVTQTELAEWFGVERKTIYNWLQRIEAGDDLVDAVADARRPGRPSKLSDEDQRQLAHDLEKPPDQQGSSAIEWTPEVLRDHIESKFDERYSIPSCRRFLSELVE